MDTRADDNPQPLLHDPLTRLAECERLIADLQREVARLQRASDRLVLDDRGKWVEVTERKLTDKRYE